MSISIASISTAQVNASLALSDRSAFGVLTTEPTGLKADGSVKETLLQWMLQPVFDTQNKLVFFRLSFIQPTGKDKGSLVESARLQPSKTQGFSVTFQISRSSTVDAIAQFTTLENATRFVQTNVLPPSFFQLAYVYANTAQSDLKDMDSIKSLTTATAVIWKTALETGNRLLPGYFPKAIAESFVEHKPATVEVPTVTEQPVTVEQPAIGLNGKKAK